MKDFLAKVRYRLTMFMQGRYGMDELNKALLVAYLVIALIQLIFKIKYINYVALLLVLWCLFRCYSKNLYARSEENRKYHLILNKVLGKWNLYKRMWNDRKTHRYFKCPNCKKVLRVPKGKGKICITCPQCGTEIHKKS